MQLTRNERLVLFNQYRILEALDPDNADHYQRVRTVIGCGYEIEYNHLFAEVCDDQNVFSREKCIEVLDILDMHDALKTAYDALDNKGGVDARRIKFSGFDGNNECTHLGYARHVAAAENSRFAKLAGHDSFNSHAPLLPLYRRMLKAWRASKDSQHLTKDDIIRVTSVKMTPQPDGGSTPPPKRPSRPPTPIHTARTRRRGRRA